MWSWTARETAGERQGLQGWICCIAGCVVAIIVELEQYQPQNFRTTVAVLVKLVGDDGNATGETACVSLCVCTWHMRPSTS